VHHAVEFGAPVYLGRVPRCKNHEACSKQANFGYKGKPPIYCKTCIPEDLKDLLVNVVTKRCEVEGCDTQPSFGKLGDKVSALFVAGLPSTSSAILCTPKSA
jgi:EsV-1-7 cysteine-rich motif